MDVAVLQEAKRRLEAIPHEMREIYHVAVFTPCVKLNGRSELSEAAADAASKLPVKTLLKWTLLPGQMDTAMGQQRNCPPENRVQSPFTGKFGSCYSAYFASAEMTIEMARASLNRFLPTCREVLSQVPPDLLGELCSPLHELDAHHEDLPLVEWPLFLHHFGLAKRQPFLTPQCSIVVGFDALGTLNEDGDCLSDNQIIELIRHGSNLRHAPDYWSVIHIKNQIVPDDVYASVLVHNVVDTSLAILDYLFNMKKSTQTSDTPVSCAPSQPDRNLCQFPTPAHSNWSDVHVVFVSDEKVRINVGKVSRSYTFVELGFADGRTKKPDTNWELLIGIAEAEGKVVWHGRGPVGKKGKMAFSRIRNRLRSFFGLSDDPFQRYQDGDGYVTKFRISRRDA